MSGRAKCAGSTEEMKAQDPRICQPRFFLSLRSLFLAVGFMCVLAAAIGWFAKIHETERLSGEIGEMIDSLAGRRPQDMTRKQWSAAYHWTVNLHSGSMLHSASRADLRRFQIALQDRLHGRVDMDTILWIWDEYKKLTTSGNNYQKFRQQMIDEVDGKYPKHSWGGEGNIP